MSKHKKQAPGRVLVTRTVTDDKGIEASEWPLKYRFNRKQRRMLMSTRYRKRMGV